MTKKNPVHFSHWEVRHFPFDGEPDECVYTGSDPLFRDPKATPAQIAELAKSTAEIKPENITAIVMVGRQMFRGKWREATLLEFEFDG